MIKNIIFDIGKVLIGFDWESYLGRMFDEETAQKVTAATFGSGHWSEIDRAVLSEEEILELFYRVGPDIKEEIKQTYDRLGECVERLDWAIPFIDVLKEKGYKIYYLSNMSEHALGSNPPAFDFVDHMDGGVFSCDVHLVKPDPAIFEALLEKYGFRPEECIFIDDHPENAAAARKLGMKAITFTSREQMESDLDKALTKDAGHDRISVLCYGDSNTFGYDPRTGGRYPYEKRWTTILGEMLGDRFEVINEGLNGRTTAYDRPDAAWKNGISSIIACLGTHKPVDYLVIMLGTNDCDAIFGLTAEQIAEGMETLVNIAEKESPGLQGYVPEIIVTVPAAIAEDYQDSPFAWELTPESVRNSREIAPLYRELAARHMIRFADASELEVSEDCEHLTEKSHRQLAELLFKVMTGRPQAVRVPGGKVTP